MKNKNYDNISKYKSYKKIYKFSKPKSYKVIEFMTNDLPDEWLIDIVEYRKKSGVITLDFMILQKEITKWIDKYKSDGYSLTNN